LQLSTEVAVGRHDGLGSTGICSRVAVRKAVGTHAGRGGHAALGPLSHLSLAVVSTGLEPSPSVSNAPAPRPETTCAVSLRARGPAALAGQDGLCHDRDQRDGFHASPPPSREGERGQGIVRRGRAEAMAAAASRSGSALREQPERVLNAVTPSQRRRRRRRRSAGTCRPHRPRTVAEFLISVARRGPPG
jgi:hypothetical protein